MDGNGSWRGECFEVVKPSYVIDKDPPLCEYGPDARKFYSWKVKKGDEVIDVKPLSFQAGFSEERVTVLKAGEIQCCLVSDEYVAATFTNCPDI
jgi:hypothetical protein